MTRSTRGGTAAPHAHSLPLPSWRLRLSASVLVASLAACGGGGDAITTQTSASPTTQASADTRSRPMAVSGALGTPNSSSGLMAGDGWVALPPQLPVMTAGTHSIYRADHTGTGYHVSPDGDDSRDGLTPETAWRTLVRATRVDGAGRAPVSFKAGDAILLKCGGVWNNGEMVLGSEQNPSLNNGILLASYGCDGTQPRPILSGASPLPAANNASWVTQGSGVQTLALTGPIKRLYRQGVPEMPARYPNGQPGRQFAPATLLPAVSNETTAQKEARDRRYFKITGSQLDDVRDKDLVGATVYVRTTTYTTEAALIQSFDPATGVVELATSFAFPIKKNAGYILEGKPWMVDEAGEWALAGNTLHYAAAQPPATGDLRAAVPRKNAAGGDKPTIGLWLYKIDNLRVEHLRFEHNDSSISLTQGRNVRIRDIESAYAHDFGVAQSESSDIEFLDNRIEDSGIGGLVLRVSDRVRVSGNLVSGTGAYRVGERIGACRKDSDLPCNIPFSEWAIRVQGAGSIVENNFVRNTANVGIAFSDLPGTVIRNNTVINTCLLRADCGGIYTSSEALDDKRPQDITSEILNNRIAGVTSQLDGAHVYGDRDSIAGENQANGIYLDDNSTTIKVDGNVVVGAEVGIYLHNSAYNLVTNNVTRHISHASFLASSDNKDMPWVMRGNQVTGNTFFSRRTVDPAAFDLPTYQGVRGKLTYAQLWLHSSQDASSFFWDSSAGTHDRNLSTNNKVFTLSKVDKPSVWRMESPDRRFSSLTPTLEQVSGAVWGLRTQNNPHVQLGLKDWLAVTGSASSATPDSELSPVSYLTHQVGQGSQLLLNPAFTGTFLKATWTPENGKRTWVGSTNCPLKTSCAKYSATGVDDRLTSNTFDLSSGALYAVGYTVKGGATDARHSAHIGRPVSSPTAPLQVLMPVTPMTTLKGSASAANAEDRRIETFFRSPSAIKAALSLRGSDGSSAWFNKELYFANATLKPVTSINVLPPLSDLGVTVINASSAERTFNCSELGLSSTDCPSRLLDVNGKALTSVKVPAGAVSQVYLNLPGWRITN